MKRRYRIDLERLGRYDQYSQCQPPLLTTVRHGNHQSASEHLCVCALCVYEEHKGHEIIPLKDACDQQKIQLQTADHLLQENINSRVKKITELRGSVRVSHAAANRELSDGVQVFKALKESVERGLDLLISEINKKKSHTEQQAGALIQEIEQELCELKKRRAEVKQHFQDEDPILLLKTSQMNPETPTRDWTSASVCAPTYRGSVARAVSQLEQEFNEKTRRLFQEELRRVKTNRVHVPLETKSSEITVQQGKDHSEPSQSTKAVSLSDGGYIEAQVRGKAEWTLGVAQESVNRKGSLTLNPQNGFWTLSLKDGRLYVSDNPKISVLTKCKPEKVGVSVDNNEGVISFYDVDASALLYSFTGVSFKEKLQPFCCPDLLYEEFFSGGLCLGCDDVRRQD
uniref:B30.2/SPRY domain-containing protein n=1 Tax=Knipowitschia caucasica TaxID=637954 RepID=A0AAV2KPW4_KNICA